MSRPLQGEARVPVWAEDAQDSVEPAGNAGSLPPEHPGCKALRCRVSRPASAHRKRGGSEPLYMRDDFNHMHCTSADSRNRLGMESQVGGLWIGRIGRRSGGDTRRA